MGIAEKNQSFRRDRYYFEDEDEDELDSQSCSRKPLRKAAFIKRLTGAQSKAGLASLESLF
jgi:hypothetical protein